MAATKTTKTKAPADKAKKASKAAGPKPATTGDKLKKPASDTVLAYVKSVENLSRDEGLFAAFDLKNDFADAWYAANHPAAGATERVSQELLGDDHGFTLTFPAMRLTRTYQSFAQAGKEVIDARVWAGIHFRSSDEHGYELGRRVADHALQTTLRPVP